MAGGRPRAFATVKALQQGIDEYFAKEAAEGWPVTVSGLACVLGVDRRTVLRYANGEHEFCPTIKAAVAFIESDKVKKMLKGDYNTTAGIFDLTNNHDWINQKYIKEEVKLETKPDPQSAEEIANVVQRRLEAAHIQRSVSTDTGK